jgi:large subunit ribosomal protein L23
MTSGFVRRTFKTASENRLLCVLRHLRVTEKSTELTQHNQYTFVVGRNATKREICQAVEKFFKVDVVGVNTLNVHGKVKRFRGTLGARSAFKKAIVTLKSGQTIDMEQGYVA